MHSMNSLYVAALDEGIFSTEMRVKVMEEGTWISNWKEGR